MTQNKAAGVEPGREAGFWDRFDDGVEICE